MDASPLWPWWKEWVSRRLRCSLRACRKYRCLRAAASWRRARLHAQCVRWERRLVLPAVDSLSTTLRAPRAPAPVRGSARCLVNRRTALPITQAFVYRRKLAVLPSLMGMVHTAERRLVSPRRGVLWSGDALTMLRCLLTAGARRDLGLVNVHSYASRAHAPATMWTRGLVRARPGVHGMVGELRRRLTQNSVDPEPVRA